jgi:hypothetical protein
MANYDFVLPYVSEFEIWLRDRGYPHPVPQPGNRFPTKQEVLDAIVSTGTLQVDQDDEREFFAVKKGAEPGGGYEIRIGCSDWEALGESPRDSITMHGGSMTVELMLLEMLSHKCGQLLLYPDTGAPAIIVQPGMNAEGIAELWKESCEQSDPWKYFYEEAGY